MLRHFGAQPLRKAVDRKLARGIDAVAGGAHLAGHRRNVDDEAAPARDHARQRQARGVDQRQHVGAEEILHRRHRQVFGPYPQPLTGIVDEDIEAPEGLLRDTDQAFDLAVVAYIGRHDERLAAGRAQFHRQLLQGVNGAGGQHHAGAFAAEPARQLATDAAGRAGDDHNLILEPLHNSPHSI